MLCIERVIEKDVVDSSGGDSRRSRGGGVVREAYREGPPERANHQQGPPISEPPRPPHD